MLRIRILGLLMLCGCGPDLQERRDLPYDTRGGERTVMDLFFHRTGAARPGIMLVHGGSWQSGSKGKLEDHAQRLAASGYVTANINYRLTPEGAFPVAFLDVQCALATLRLVAGEVGLDPERVAVLGYSAGGHLASLAGVATGHPDLEPGCQQGTPARPQAVISGAGPQDMRALPAVERVKAFMGGSAEELPIRYALASPIDHAAPGAPPFLFVHGTIDIVVSIAHSRRMHAALLAHGNDAELVEIAGAGHSLGPGPTAGEIHHSRSIEQPEAWPAIYDFLARTIGSPP